MSSEDRTSRAGVSAPRKRAPLPMRCDTSYRASALRSLLKKWETLAVLGIVEAGLREVA